MDNSSLSIAGFSVVHSIFKRDKARMCICVRRAEVLSYFLDYVIILTMTYLLLNSQLDVNRSTR